MLARRLYGSEMWKTPADRHLRDQCKRERASQNLGTNNDPFNRRWARRSWTAWQYYAIEIYDQRVKRRSLLIPTRVTTIYLINGTKRSRRNDECCASSRSKKLGILFDNIFMHARVGLRPKYVRRITFGVERERAWKKIHDALSPHRGMSFY